MRDLNKEELAYVAGGTVKSKGGSDHKKGSDHKRSSHKRSSHKSPQTC